MGADPILQYLPPRRRCCMGGLAMRCATRGGRRACEIRAQARQTKVLLPVQNLSLSLLVGVKFLLQQCTPATPS